MIDWNALRHRCLIVPDLFLWLLIQRVVISEMLPRLCELHAEAL